MHKRHAMNTVIANHRRFGISRLGNTTGLDRIGIPTFSATMPGTSDVIWIYSGKGTSVREAKLSAVMECLERTAALWDVSRVTVSSIETLKNSCRFVDPNCFTEKLTGYSLSRPVAWVWGISILDGQQRLVPAELAFNGYRPAEIPQGFFSISSSNGLAAAFSLEHALLHGIEECIERDAVSVAELRCSHYGLSFLVKIAQAFGIDDSCVTSSYRDQALGLVEIKPETLPKDIAAIHKKIARASVEIRIKAISNDMGIPVFCAACVEDVGDGSHLQVAGYGASLCARRALRSALLELCQSRATDKQGGREDCISIEKKRSIRPPAQYWITCRDVPVASFDEVVSQYFRAGSRTVDTYCRRLAEVGLEDVLYVRFPRYEGIEVVRVLIPGIETWHATAGESRIGARVMKYIGSEQ